MADTERSSRLPVPGRRSLLPAPKKVIYTSNEKDNKEVRPSAVQTDEEKLSQKQYQVEAEQLSRLPHPGRKNRSLVPPQKRPDSIEREVKEDPEPSITQTDEEKLYHKQYQVGDKVVIGDVKLGRLLYFGTTHLAKGYWCGIELDDCEGKHDGKVQGVRYFRCKKGHGIFAPIEKVKKYEGPVIDNYEWDSSADDLVQEETKPKKKLFQPKYQKVSHSEQTFIVVSQKSTKEVSNNGNAEEALSPDVKECLSSDRRQYLNLTFDAEQSQQPHNLPDIVSPLAYRCANTTDNSGASFSKLKDTDYSDNDSSLGLINSRLLEQADILRDISFSSKKPDDVSLHDLEQQLQLLTLGSTGTPDPELEEGVTCSTPLVVVRRQNKSQNQGNRVCNIPLDNVFVFPSPKKPSSPSNDLNRTFEIDDACNIPVKESTIADDILKENTEIKNIDSERNLTTREHPIDLPEAEQEEPVPENQKTFIIEQGITEIEYNLDLEEEILEASVEKSEPRVSFHESIPPPPRQEKRPMIDSGISEREDFEFDHGEFIENFDANGIYFPYSQFHQMPVSAEDATSDSTINDSLIRQMSNNSCDSSTSRSSTQSIKEVNSDKKMDQLAVDIKVEDNRKNDRPTSYLSTTSTDTGYVPDTPTEERVDRPADLIENAERNIKNDAVCEPVMPDVTREGAKREEMVGKPPAPLTSKTEQSSEDGISPTKSQTTENTCSDEVTVLQISSGSPANAEVDDIPDFVEDDRAEVDQSPHSANDTSVEEEILDDKNTGDETFSCSIPLEDIAEDNEREDSTDDRPDDNEDNSSKSKEDENKPKYVPRTPKLARSDIHAAYAKPNTNVGSRLADYIKSPIPVKPKDESAEKIPKKKINKKALDREIERRKSLEMSPRPKVEVEEKKEPPKIIKRTPPKSKWGNIMSQIETNKDQIKIKPKTEVKSKLEAYLTTSPAPVKEKPPKKPETRKILPTPPKLDFSKVKSKLNITSPSPKSKTDLGSKLRELSASQSTLYSTDSRRSSIHSNDSRSSMGSRVNSHVDLTGKENDDAKSGSSKHAASNMLSNRSRRASMTSLASDTSQTSVKAMNIKNIKKSQETQKRSRSSLPPTLNTSGRFSSPSSPKHSPLRSAKSTDSTTNLTKTRHASGRTDTNKLPSKINKTSNQTKEPLMREKSPYKQKTSASYDQNRNKTSKSKLPSTRPGEKPTSKVSGTKTKNAAEEIRRLEELCESRTQNLNKANLELKHIVKSFDAMAVLIQYLTEDLHAFHTPHLVKELDVVHQKLKNSEGVITELDGFKSRLEQEIVDLKKQQEKVIEELKKNQEDELNIKKSEIEKQKADDEKELEDVRTKLKEEHEALLKQEKESSTRQHKEHLKKVEHDIKEEVKALKENHEAYVREVTVNFEEEINRMKQKHLTSITILQGKHDDQMEELHKQHRDKLEEITHRFEEIKHSLSEKVESLKKEITDLRNKEDSLRDADTKKEIESLNLVISMRNEEIQKLRQKNSELEKKLEEIPISREKITTLQQKMENLEAICNIKSDHEKQLSDKCQILMRKYDKEHKAKKRISMDFEELVYKIQSPDIMSDSTESLFKHQLSHSPPESESNSPRVSRKSRSAAGDRSSPSPRRQHRWSTSLSTPSGSDITDRKLRCRSGTYERDGSSSPRSISTPPSRNSPNTSMTMSQPLNDIEVFESPRHLVSSVHSDSGVILRNNHAKEEEDDLTSF